MPQPKVSLAKAIARTLHIIGQHQRMGDNSAAEPYEEYLEYIHRMHFPSGSGFDNGCRLVAGWQNKYRDDTSISGVTDTYTQYGSFHIVCDFHHMNDNGFYTGWTNHVFSVYPCIHDFDGWRSKIHGRDRNDIKNYIDEVMHETLTREVVYGDTNKGSLPISFYNCLSGMALGVTA